MKMEPRVDQKTKESLEPPEVLNAGSYCEKDTPYFFEEFTLSTGCCSDEVENKVIN
jgi:hypothetical protein